MKKRLKRFIIEWQLRLLLAALAVQGLLVGALAFAVPKISNATQAIIGAGQASLLLLVMLADVLKTDDTEK